MKSSSLVALLSVLFTGSDAFRIKSGRGAQGLVDLVYLYGAPTISAPSFTNFSRCFAGKRVVHVDKVFLSKKYDMVVGAGRKFGFSSAMIDLQELDIESKAITNTPCSAATTQKPTGIWAPSLHKRTKYMATIEAANLPVFEKAMGNFAEIVAFEYDNTDFVKEQVEGYGWKLVASARHTGGKIVGGPQVVHLIQHPQTLDCVVTFQGTVTTKDWLANAGGSKTEFCGRSEQVHDGIKYAFELSTGSDDFQSKIRPRLSKCRRVISVGQSQGAAQAEMFAACVNQPRNNNALYRSMTWERGSPEQLPYL